MELTGKCKEKFEDWVLSNASDSLFSQICYPGFTNSPNVDIDLISKDLLREIYRRFFRSVNMICYVFPGDGKDIWHSVVLHDDTMSPFFTVNIEDRDKEFVSDDIAMDNALLKANNFYNRCM